MGNDIVPVVMFGCIAICVIGLPLVRGLVRKWERQEVQPRIPSEVLARLERMEQSIDAMAIEMERVSEGQRFVTRILAQPAAEPVTVRGEREKERA